jgi:hypothetical protein
MVNFRGFRASACSDRNVPYLVSTEELLNPHGPDEVVLGTLQLLEIVDGLLFVVRHCVCKEKIYKCHGAPRSQHSLRVTRIDSLCLIAHALLWCLSSVGFYVCLRFVQRRIFREVLFVTVEACLCGKYAGRG